MRPRWPLLAALLLLFVAAPAGTAGAAVKHRVAKQRKCRVSHKHRVCFWVVVKKNAPKPKPKPKPKAKAAPVPAGTPTPAEAHRARVTAAARPPAHGPTVEPQPDS